jgi:hypothetical protein
VEPNVATAAKPVKIPGPDHPITIERNPARIVVSVAGRVVADTREALTLREAAYPAVQYIPRKDPYLGYIGRRHRRLLNLEIAQIRPRQLKSAPAATLRRDRWVAWLAAARS